MKSSCRYWLYWIISRIAWMVFYLITYWLIYLSLNPEYNYCKFFSPITFLCGHEVIGIFESLANKYR